MANPIIFTTKQYMIIKSYFDLSRAHWMYLIVYRLFDFEVSVAISK